MGLLDRIRKWFKPRQQAEQPSDDDTAIATRRRGSVASLRVGHTDRHDWLGVEYTRQGLYEAYHQAELDHTYNSRALDIYADLTATGSAVQGDVTMSNEGQVQRRYAYTVTMDGEHLPELDEINRRTQLPSRARAICRDFIGYGDRFDELVYQRFGLERMMKLPTSQVRRLEREDGQLESPIAFVQTKANHLATGSGARSEVEFEKWQVAHYRAGTPDCGYGVLNSLFFPLLGPSRELALMNTGLVLARVTNPDGREVFYIDVGDAEGEEAEKIVSATKDRYMGTRRVDSRGRIVTEPSVLTQAEPLFIGVSKESALTKVTRLPGSSGIRDIRDIEYKRDSLLAGLAVGKMAYGLPVPYATRGAATEQMKIVQRACRSYRLDFERTTTEIYAWGLLSYGLSWEWLRERTLVYEWPSLTHEDDVNFLQLMLLRIEIAELMQSNGWLPPEETMVRYLGFAPSEVEQLIARSQANQEPQQVVTVDGEPQETLTRKTLRGYRRSRPLANSPRVVGYEEEVFMRYLDELRQQVGGMEARMEDVRESLVEALYAQRHSHHLGSRGPGFLG